MKLNLLTFCIAFLGAVYAYPAETAAQLLDKAVSKISRSSGVVCSFAVSGNGNNLKGELISSGNKFKLVTPAGTTWYDGKSMWTASNSSKEITLVTPTAQEINESNPFAYLSGYETDYKVYFSRRKSDTCHLVLLNPKKKNAEIKAVEIDLNKKTLLPERFIIRDRSDKVVTVSVSSLSIGKKTSASVFVCPVDKMEGFEVVDLR